MKVHTLDIDSGERDPISYPNPADYVVTLKSPIYDVTKISMISARIHNSQFLINERNNTFTINSTTVSIPNGNYNGRDLASNVVQESGGILTSSSFDKDTNAITFNGGSNFTFKFYTGTNGYNTYVSGKTTPHDILGLPANDITSTGNTLTTGSINLQGADAIIVKLSSGSDEFNKTIFSESPFYTGRILMCGDVINYSGVDDAVEHNFDSGAQKTISSLRVQFYYSSNNRLIPYDFRNANHILKLAVTCSTDKFVNIPKLMRDDNLPTPLSIPEFEDNHRWDVYLPIFFVVATGIFLLFVMKKPKIT
tara:strand:- start:317 stop:1240 length:924 start_codon:yes stop_codon:yes gene_type:complete